MTRSRRPPARATSKSSCQARYYEFRGREIISPSELPLRLIHALFPAVREIQEKSVRKPVRQALIQQVGIWLADNYHVIMRQLESLLDLPALTSRKFEELREPGMRQAVWLWGAPYMIRDMSGMSD